MSATAELKMFVPHPASSERHVFYRGRWMLVQASTITLERADFMREALEPFARMELPEDRRVPAGVPPADDEVGPAGIPYGQLRAARVAFIIAGGRL